MAQKPKMPISSSTIAHGNRKAISRSKIIKRIATQVIANVEFHPGVFECLESAFVRRQLLITGIIRGQNLAGADSCRADHQANQYEQQDG